MPWGKSVSLRGCLFSLKWEKSHQCRYDALKKEKKQRGCHRTESCDDAEAVPSPEQTSFTRCSASLCYLRQVRLHHVYFTVSLEHILTQTLNFWSSCHLSVPLFVIFSQFVILLCFKLQLLSEIDGHFASFVSLSDENSANLFVLLYSSPLLFSRLASIPLRFTTTFIH